MEVIVVNSNSSQPEEKLTVEQGKYGAMELEAAAALLMLRYQYDINVGCQLAQMTTTTTTPPPPPPSALSTAQSADVDVVEVDNCTPKEQVRSGNVINASTQPLKKRSIPPHLLCRSPTPAKSSPAGSRNTSSSNISGVSNNGIVKAKLKTMPANKQACNKALLKSCRNMIREFLDNQELF